jgi:hypothetical protein
MTMSDNGTLFPNLLQPAATWKAYAPMGVKFWESQETALEGLKEFADGWFARRHRAMQAALETAKHTGDADTPSDIVREYQNWLTREGTACGGWESLSATSAEGRSSPERTTGRAKSVDCLSLPERTAGSAPDQRASDRLTPFS